MVGVVSYTATLTKREFLLLEQLASEHVDLSFRDLGSNFYEICGMPSYQQFFNHLLTKLRKESQTLEFLLKNF